MNGMPMHVCDDLEFDVMRIENQFFDVNRGVSKRFFRFCARTVKSLHEARLVMRRSHAVTSAAGHCLDHHWVTNLLGNLNCVLLAVDDAFASGRARYAGLPRRRSPRI